MFMRFCDRCFHRVQLLFAIALGCATLAATPAAFGSPAADGNLLEMLQYSTGIAIVEVIDCKPFDPLYPGMTWEPQQSATCKVREVIAGSAPDTFQTAVYSADVKTGDLALAFIGRRPDDTVLAKVGHQYLFSLGGGFRLLNKLVKPGDDDANASALAAIRESAKLVKHPSEDLTDRTLMPFYRLLYARDHNVRRWAFGVLRFAPMSPLVERTLVSCLNMGDHTLSTGAADVIVYRRLEMTAELERFLSRQQREALPYAIPRLVKRIVVGPPDFRNSVEVRVSNYLFAVKIQRYLRSLPEADTERFWEGVSPLLTEERQPWIAIGFRIDENGRPRALAQGVGPGLETLELLEHRLASFLADVDVKPLSAFDVRFLAAGDSPRIEVFPGR
jgi:hypothetical protein